MAYVVLSLETKEMVTHIGDLTIINGCIQVIALNYIISLYKYMNQYKNKLVKA